VSPDLFTWADTQARERDKVLDEHERKTEAIRVASYVARRIALTHGGVTSTDVLRAMDDRHAEVIAGIDRRFVGAVLLPSKGWRKTGEVRSTGSHARKQPVWRWGGQ